ncbi:MAG: TonB-dependent receptor [Nitrospirae bacterium]|nr:TonB-dependent receptor [Nitrospirota bacterium]
MGNKSALKRFPELLIFIAVFFFLFNSPVFADNTAGADLTELSIEELMNVTVYGASKFEQKVTEAPSSVSIITSEEIKKYGYRTLSDILKSQRSFYITYDRNYSYVGVRGFGRSGDYNGRILILIDGHRINDNIYDQGFVGTEFPLDIDLIERVEIIRGPGSSLYGSNAFFAVINIITKKGKDAGWIETSGEAGSFKTYKGRLSLGHKFDSGMEMLLSGSVRDSKGDSRLFISEFDNPSTNNGIARDSDFDRNYSLFSKFSRGGFTFEGLYASRTKGIPTASFGTDFNDNRNRTFDKRGYVSLKYEHRFDDYSQIMGRLFYDIYDYEGTYVYSGILNKDIGKGVWWGGETMFVKPLRNDHKLTIGAEYQVNSKQDQKNYDKVPFTVYLDDKRESERMAVYLQDEFTILKNLMINAGLRHDNYYKFKSTNPRLAVIYNPFEKTTFKLICGTAFRIPNTYELYYEATNQKANPDLAPERINTYELVYEQFLSDNLRMTAGIFNYRIKDLIHQHADTEDGLLVFENHEEVETKGFETEIEGRWDNGMKGNLSYTYQNAKDAQTYEWLVNSPRHLAKFNLTVPLVKEKLFSGIEIQYMSRRKTLAGSRTDDFIITNLTIFGSTLVKNLEISGSAYNIFNKHYSDPAGDEHIQDVIEQDGRTFRLKITYVF